MSLSRWNPLACALFVLLAFACTSGQERKPETLLIGSGERPGLYYTVATVLAGLVNGQTAETHLAMKVEESSGSVFNINALMARSFQFGLAQMDRQAEAYLGLGYWDGMPQERLRFVASLYPEVVAILALDSSGFTRVSDLEGKRIGIGPPGSGTHGDAIAILDVAGVQEYDANESSPKEAIRLLQTGDLDAIFFTGGESGPLLKAAAAAKPPMRLLSISNRDGLLRQELGMEAADLEGLGDEGPVETVRVRTALLSSVDVPDSQVYAVTQILFEGLDSIREGHPQFADLDEEEMIQGAIAPIHPGALEYYQKMGWL